MTAEPQPWMRDAAKAITDEVRRDSGYWLAGDWDNTIAALIATAHASAPSASVETRKYQPSARDWTEDFAHENGQYLGTCCFCGAAFMGHKRRPACRVCTPPSASAAAGGALADVATERARQVAVEGWTPEHDDQHASGALALAAGCYALYAGGMTDMGCDRPGNISDDERWSMPQHWPWACEWWKPKDARRDLIRAAALIVAEIERLDRATAVLPRPAASAGVGEEKQDAR